MEKTVFEYAETAEIYPAMEDGNYKAFIVQVSGENTDFSLALKNSGDENAIEKFIAVIDERINLGDFDDPILLVEQMYGKERGFTRNLDAERIVVSSTKKFFLAGISTSKLISKNE